uniref:60S ribosomal export protein NMD3 n=1 Tax=Physcomitrium patens TaxID=3218 RepID=A0A2K1IYK1_PHYPA|nr:hypothetical protein PHYPA_024172 [Physcomitrium patens]
MAADMFTVPHTVGRVLCCICGVTLPRKASNICVTLLRCQVDITDGLQKLATVLYFRECGQFLQPPRTWVKAELESKEPFKEVINGAILEQAYVVDQRVEDHMCEKCSRVAANPDQWIAFVQVKQKVKHKRTFFFQEQLIIKHGSAAAAVNIKQIHDGMDFHFEYDKHLVPQDSKSNTYNYRFTMSVEICPACKDGLICFPEKVAASLGNIDPLVLCTQVSNSLLLLDPQTLRTAYTDANQYWRTGFSLGFRPLLHARQLVEYTILDIEIDPSASTRAGKYVLADVQETLPWGCNVYSANTNDPELEKYRNLSLPNVVLVKKRYEEKRTRRRGKPRPWKLKALDMEIDPSAIRQDRENVSNVYERILEEIKEDLEMHAMIALYGDVNYRPQSETAAMIDGDGDEPPSVQLEELLADLRIDCNNDESETTEDEQMDDA